MNILDIQEALKDFSEQQLIKEMQSPSGSAPQFLVLSELNRRKRMKADFQARQAQQAPTVAEALVASAGVPTQEMTQMSAQMAPSTDMAQNSGVMAMKKGGLASSHPVDSDGVQHAALAAPFIPAIAGGLARGASLIPRGLSAIRSSKVGGDAIKGAVGKRGFRFSDLYGGKYGIGASLGLGAASLFFGGDDDEEEGGVRLTNEYEVRPDSEQGGLDLTPDPRQQELQELLDEYDELSEKSVRDADMNKYLALAAAGFQLMQPDEGGFAGAASKAGLAGLKTLQDSDAAYNKAVTDRLATRIKLFDATKPPNRIDQLAKIAKTISVLQTERERTIDEAAREQIDRQIDMLVQQQRQLMGVTQGSNVLKVN
tara:strand:+ start:2800 stop:3909 length:1110 start_codon:yes stop_codon:yes gene_type:complete